MFKAHGKNFDVFNEIFPFENDWLSRQKCNLRPAAHLRRQEDNGNSAVRERVKFHFGGGDYKEFPRLIKQA